MEDEEILLECPNCTAIWGIDEIQFQQCYSCGYPDNDDNEYEEEGAEDEDFYSNQVSEEPCTNCGKLAILTITTNGDGEEDGKMCYECCEESGYCASCGYFSAGTTDYDFSQIGAYCGECQRELQEDEYDEDEYFDYDY